MARLQLVILFIGFFAINMKKTHAITDEEKKEMIAMFTPHFIECSTKYDIGAEVIKAIQKDGSFEDLDVCFVACTLKKVDLLDSEGKYNVANAKALIKKYAKNQDDQNKLEEIVDKCSTVNDQDVSDGSEGCDRSKLLIKCFIPHKKLIWSD